MHSASRMFLLLVVILCPAQSQWVVDTVSPDTFTPLKVGNEWVYFDSQHTIGSPPYIWDDRQYERTVRIMDHVYDDSSDFWLASITLKGTLSRQTYFKTDLATDTFGIVLSSIDSSYTDTLRVISDTGFSDGMRSLFPFLGYSDTDTSVRISRRQSGDTLIVNISRSSSWVPVSAGFLRMTVVSSVGMVFYSDSWGSRTGSSNHETEKLIRFNGVDVNWEELSPVRMSPFTSVPRTAAPVLWRVCAFKGSGGFSPRVTIYSLQGRKIPLSAGVSSGVMVTIGR